MGEEGATTSHTKQCLSVEGSSSRAAGRGIHSSLGWVHWPRKESGLGNNSVYLREGEEVPVEDKILDRTVRETLLRK